MPNPAVAVNGRDERRAVAFQDGNALPFLNLKAQAVQEVFADDEKFC